MDHEEKPSVSRSVGPRSLESLGPDILLLIAEQVYLTHANRPFHLSIQHPLHNLRLVSHRLNTAVLPFSYRTMAIKAKLLNLPQNEHTQQFWNNVYKYTRNLVFLWPLRDYYLAAKILSSCVYIESIHWSKRSIRNNKFGDLFIPPEIGESIRDHWPMAKLHLVEFAWKWISLPESRMPSVPFKNIVSLSTQNRWGYTNVKTLQQFAAQLPILQSLEFHSMTKDFLPSGPRLPPIKKLSLISCDWKYSPADVESIWDFSHLTSLTIISDTNTNTNEKFFLSLRRDALRNLKELKVTQSHNDPFDRGLTPELHHFISNAADLASIDITCDVKQLNINSLMDQWTQMRVLKIHDYTGFAPNAEVCPTISIADLTKLQKCCPKLRELGLDLDTRTRDKLAFIKIISAFRNLTTITLHTETPVTEFGEYNEITIGPDHRSATPSLIDHLLLYKTGLPFEFISIKTGGHGVPVSSLSTEEWEA